MPEVDLTGVNEITYPTLETWEWPVAAYLFLGGLVAGLMILGAVLRLRRDPIFRKAIFVADLFALPLLALGLLMLFIDLTNRWNAWRFFTTFQVTSAMSWGSWILLLSGVVIVLRIARHIPASIHSMWFQWAKRPMAVVRAWALKVDQKLLDIVTIALGVGLGFYTGVLLSSIAARPLWNTAVLAPLFLVSGLASGGAFICLFISREAHHKLVPLSLGLCGAEGLLLLAYLVSLWFGTLATQRAGDVLLGGGFGFTFWFVVVLAGLGFPLIVETADWLRRRVPLVVERAAPVLKLVGSGALRFVIVFAGLQTFL
ncbi:MAG: polysulfide reductase NrfD [Acidimicrobiia bacterium]|nr:polysulfide reductase NrfD [Acidimicrobiia bacterium]